MIARYYNRNQALLPNNCSVSVFNWRSLLKYGNTARTSMFGNGHVLTIVREINGARVQGQHMSLPCLPAVGGVQSEEFTPSSAGLLVRSRNGWGCLR